MFRGSRFLSTPRSLLSPSQTRGYVIRGRSKKSVGWRSFSEACVEFPKPPVTSADGKELTQEEKDEIFDQRWVDYFSQEGLDKWLLRNGFNHLYGMDLVPEPKIVVSILNACRRMNDFPTAMRVLESVRVKSVTNPEIYEYIIQEIRPTLTELGIPTPEELGIA